MPFRNNQASFVLEHNALCSYTKHEAQERMMGILPSFLPCFLSSFSTNLMDGAKLQRNSLGRRATPSCLSNPIQSNATQEAGC
mmetsp:Transcript_6861/g.18633  ORF Transcript_6861/g.18633 Transcript_6861/m.18633 type:complete len:83 (-) Transcript_6861:435-683(-)